MTQHYMFAPLLERLSFFFLGTTRPPLSTIAVVSNQVGASIQVASDSAAGAQSLDSAGNRGWGGEVLQSLEVQGKTDNVGSSHGGATVAGGGSVGANVG